MAEKSFIAKDESGIGQTIKRILLSVRQLFNGYSFYLFETLAAFLFVAFGKEEEGAVVFVALLSVILVVCDDILPTTLPFLLLCAFTTNCYDSYDVFMPYLRYAPAVALCLVFHFVFYRRPMKAGYSSYGIFAVAVAVTLGGIGKFSVTDYAYGAYYVLGLGFGMWIAYFLMKSQFFADRDYDLRIRFSAVMLLLGVLCTLMIATGYYRYLRDLVPKLYPAGFSRNNLSTLLMFAMPFPLYLGRKKQWLSLFTPVFYAAICVTTSRGGLLFGSVEFFVCCVYWILQGEKKILRTVVCALTVAVVFLCFGKIIVDVVRNRLLADDIITKDARYKMMLQSFEKFRENPLLGFGILDKDLYYASFKKRGSMSWYHMMIPQIIGSMGLVGIAAYGYQFFGRIKLVFTKKCVWSYCLGISYLGILLMSQVNPGEFCPLPFELLTVLLFILQENRLENHPFPLQGKKTVRLFCSDSVAYIKV